MPVLIPPSLSKYKLIEKILSIVEAYDKNDSFEMVQNIVDYITEVFFDPDECIADVWHYTRVQIIRDDLDDGQAIKVLRNIINDLVLYNETSLTSSLVKSYADALFPPKEARIFNKIGSGIKRRYYKISERIVRNKGKNNRVK
ncbi:MAG: hypothetical protein KME49_22560 [Brasilonema octagenarum HA4186-MV1]|jgi:hypothetical protein|nr:hypothetical protein [Brasilonema octagenarum HA4186-MV1]